METKQTNGEMNQKVMESTATITRQSVKEDYEKHRTLSQTIKKTLQRNNNEDGDDLEDLRKRGIKESASSTNSEEKNTNRSAKKKISVRRQSTPYKASDLAMKIIFSLAGLMLFVFLYVFKLTPSKIKVSITNFVGYMDYTSIVFLFILLPIFLLIYFLVKTRNSKNIVFFIFSILFIGYGAPYYILVFLLSSLASYYFCKSIYKDIKNGKELQARGTQSFIIAYHIAMLVMFGFFNSYAIGFKNLISSSLNIRPLIAPVGITVYTLSGISYAQDTYRGLNVSKVKYLDVALYMGMFTRILVGPYESAKKVITQLRSRETRIYSVGEGAKILLKGIIEKFLIADNILYLFNRMSSFESDELSALSAWLGAFALLLGIYFKLKAYTDIGLGISKMLGFDFSENFNEPLRASSIVDIKNRWMISLFSWLREYLYVPLKMKSHDNTPTFSKGNILVVLVFCLLSGFEGRYIIGGIFFSICVMLEYSIRGGEKILRKSRAGLIYTKIAMLIGIVFFGSNNVSQAFKYIKSMFFLGNGLFDKVGLYYFRTYFIIFVILIFISTPSMVLRLIKLVRKVGEKWKA